MWQRPAKAAPSAPSARTARRKCPRLWIPTPQTGRICKVARDGTITTVATGFPSAQDAMGDLIGVADVAFIGNTLYALAAGAVAPRAMPPILAFDIAPGF